MDLRKKSLRNYEISFNGLILGLCKQWIVQIHALRPTYTCPMRESMLTVYVYMWTLHPGLAIMVLYHLGKRAGVSL